MYVYVHIYLLMLIYGHLRIFHKELDYFRFIAGFFPKGILGCSLPEMRIQLALTSPQDHQSGSSTATFGCVYPVSFGSNSIWQYSLHSFKYILHSLYIPLQILRDIWNRRFLLLFCWWWPKVSHGTSTLSLFHFLVLIICTLEDLFKEIPRNPTRVI